MKFELPTAERENVEKLLEVLGDRAEDFKRCFDIENEWCWKYAGLMLRGMEKRVLEYGERHHVVPFVYYKRTLEHCTRKTASVNKGNLSVLGFGEHVYAHFCIVKCVKDTYMRQILATAFCHMSGFKSKIADTDLELLGVISETEIKMVRLLNPSVAKVEAEGRTHFWEDPEKAVQEWRALHREEAKERSRKWYAENKDRSKEWRKTYNIEHHDELQASRKKFRENNREVLREKSKQDYYDHRDQRLISRKAKYDKMVADGFKFRKDPVTGKRCWIFVGLHTQEQAA